MSDMTDWKIAEKRTIRHKQFLIAVSDSNFEEINRLISMGVDVNVQDDNGETAMFVAIKHADSTVIQFLIDKGSDLDVKNNNHETPLNFAKRVKRPDVVQMLEKAKNDYSQTLLSNVEVVSKNESEKMENTMKKKKTEGWINPVHGNIYQLKVLMLFLYRGVTCKYSFRLGTEIKEARKFDDLVFEYTQGNKKVYRLLQAKHKLDESKKITVDKLLAETHGDYSLLKYFHSYQACKRDPFFKNGVIKDVIICTNIDFDFSDLKKADVEVYAVKEKDDILDIKSGEKLSMRYKFTKSLVPKLKRRLQSSKFDSGCKISDEDIEDFLQHLIFAVNQPNEEELGMIVKNEISKEFDSITTENAYNKFFIQMLDWMKGKTRNAFWSHEDGIKLFAEITKGMALWHNVQDPVKGFTGRIEPLKNIHRLLQTRENVIVCVSGLGGVGKSELAKKYIAEYTDSYDDKVIWINAESYQTLVDSFRELACDKLGIKAQNTDGKEKDINVLVAEIYQCLSNGKSLFVFDNSEMYKSQSKLDAGIDKFLPCLPSNCKKPSIIITSRNQKWPNNVKVQILEAFTEEEAESFITQSLQLKNGEQSQYTEELGKKLQFLPLALQQAVAFINAQNDVLINVGSSFQVADYLIKLSEKNEELLNFELSSDCDSMYTRTVFTTWNVTLDAIKHKENGNDALDLLNILSYLLSDNIPSEILFIFVKDKEKLASAITLLKQYSLINIEYKVINLHRLVQQVTRMKLAENNSEEQILESMLKEIQWKHINFKNVDNFLFLWTYSTKYIELVEQHYSIPITIMSTLTSCARNAEVHQMGNEIIKLLEQLPSDNRNAQIGLMETEECIATAFLHEGKFEIALKKFREMAAKPYPQGMPRYKSSDVAFNIAITLQRLGRNNEALEDFQNILKWRRLNFGENHPSTLSIKNEVATTLMDMGKYAEAKRILQQCYEAEKAIFGEYHQNTITVESNLAMILFYEIKLKEALKMLQDVYNKMITFLPESDFKVIATRCNIAQVYKGQKKYDLSFKTYEDIYKKNSPILGENHPQMLRSQMHMTRNLHKMGKSNKALKILRELFVKQRNVLGLEHPDILRTQFGMAEILLEQGQQSEALQHFQELLRHEIPVFGNDHPYTMLVRQYIGQILSDQGQYDKAMEYDLESLKIYKNKCGMTDPSTLNARRNVGMLYKYKGDYDKALSILTELQKDQETVLGKKDISYIHTQNAIREILFVKRTNPRFIVSQMPKDPLAAVQSNNITLLKELVRDGADVDTSDQSGMTLLHYAANGDQLKIIEFLLENGADVTRVSSKGNTVLHIAASKNYTDVAKLLLENVSNDEFRKFVDAKTTTSESTALHVASKYGFYEMSILLLSHAATYNVKNKEGQRPIDIAKDQVISKLLNKVDVSFQQANAGNEKLHKSFQEISVDEYLACINARDCKGHDILQMAMIHNHQNLVSSLLASKLEVSRRIGYKLACNNNYDELLTLSGNAVNMLDKENCVLKGSLKHVRKFVGTFRSTNKRLLDRNILAIEEMFKLLESNQDSQSFSKLAKQFIKTYIQLFSASIYSVKLLESARSQNWTLAEKCIRELAHVNLADEGGWNPLLFAVNAGNIKITKLLLDNGAQVNCSTKTGKNTPLHIAVNKGSFEIMDLLMNYDQSKEYINAKTESKGSTALHIAAKIGRVDIVLYLLRFNSVYCLKNKDGKSPMDLTNNRQLKVFFQLIDELFEDAKIGEVKIIQKLEALGTAEFLAANLCHNEEIYTLMDVTAMNEHDKLTYAIRSVMVDFFRRGEAHISVMEHGDLDEK